MTAHCGVCSAQCHIPQSHLGLQMCSCVTTPCWHAELGSRVVVFVSAPIVTTPQSRPLLYTQSLPVLMQELAGGYALV